MKVVAHDEWLEARKELLAKEKELTRLRDALSRERRELPWEAVDKEYAFGGPNGKESLAELFDGRSQLVVSRAAVDKLAAYRERMGWSFHWVSSLANDFNVDYGVSFGPEQREEAVYNYGTQSPSNSEREGLSVFCKDESGHVFHTYSSYARGIDLVNTAYTYLDLVPKGRDEDGRPPQYWVRRHDEYEP